MRIKNMLVSTCLGLLILGTILSTTLANAEATILLFQDFEEQGWQWDIPPSGWRTSTYFYFNSLYGSAYGGEQFAYSYSNNDSMVSPTLTFGTDTQLSFWYAKESSAPAQSLEIYVDGKITGDLVWSHYGFEQVTYQQATVDLSDYTNDHFIEFVNVGPTGLYGHMIDDIKITSIHDQEPPIDDNDSSGSGNSGSTTPPVTPPFESNRNPIADFSVSETITFINTDIIFNASASTDADGDTLEYEWDFGDSQQATGILVTHSYSTVGIYEVTLTIVDGQGGSDTMSKEIIINPIGNNPPKTPSVKTSTEPSEVNTVYSFLISSLDLDKDRVKFIINWGDGTPQIDTGFPSENDSQLYQINVSHQWNDAGIYSITFRAIDEHNASSEAKKVTAFIDVSVIPLDDEIVGYLVDFHRNMSFTHFYNNDNNLYTLVQLIEIQEEWSEEPIQYYLIDATADGNYDYKYNRELGLFRYTSNASDGLDDDSSQETTGFTVIISVWAIIIFLVVYKKHKR